MSGNWESPNAPSSERGPIHLNCGIQDLDNSHMRVEMYTTEAKKLVN